MKSPSSLSWAGQYGPLLTTGRGLHLAGGGVYKNKSLSFEIYLIFQFSRVEIWHESLTAFPTDLASVPTLSEPPFA